MTFYTVDEVATLLKIHRNTIVKFIESGQLKASKLGRQYRISQESLDTFLKSGVVNA